MSKEDTQKKTVDELESHRYSLGEGHPEIMTLNQEILERRPEQG